MGVGPVTSCSVTSPTPSGKRRSSATKAPAGGRGKTAKKAPRGFKGRMLWLLKWGLVAGLGLFVLAVIGLFVAYQKTSIPNPNKAFQTQTTNIYYAGGKSKIAEHGGDDRQDRNVPILVVAPRLLPGLRGGRVIGTPVETTQIAPTILALLGLNPDQLQAVQIEHTRVLPGLGA